MKNEEWRPQCPLLASCRSPPSAFFRGRGRRGTVHARSNDDMSPFPFSHCSRFILPCPPPGSVGISQYDGPSSRAYFPLSFPSFWTKHLHGCTFFCSSSGTYDGSDHATRNCYRGHDTRHGILPWAEIGHTAAAACVMVVPMGRCRGTCNGGPRQYTMARAMAAITVCHERSPTACHGQPYGMSWQAPRHAIAIHDNSRHGSHLPDLTPAGPDFHLVPCSHPLGAETKFAHRRSYRRPAGHPDSIQTLRSGSGQKN